MQLRQTKTFGMFNHNDTGLGNIDAHLNNGCGDQQLRPACAEILHRAVTLSGFHFAVRQRDADAGQGMT